MRKIVKEKAPTYIESYYHFPRDVGPIGRAVG